MCKTISNLRCAALLLSITSFTQTPDTSKNTGWLTAINNNRIQKPANNEAFNPAPAGYALYFSKVDTLNVPYLVYVPKSYDPSNAYSLIVFLHGGVVSMDSFQYKNEACAGEPIFSIADKHNAIVLYPFGRKDFGWVKQQKAFENIITTITAITQTYNINRQNIVLGGMSDGAAAAFWFITNKPELFKAFYAISPYPKLFTGSINYQNITAGKPLYSIIAKDDEVFSYTKVKAIYDQHTMEAPGWHFDSVAAGNHGFMYEDAGVSIINKLFDTLLNRNSLNQSGVNDSLTQQLSLIDYEDQRYRNQMDDVQTKYGGGSKEMKALITSMREADSINLLQVAAILGKYGWLGADAVGDEGNSALFMVIQHADKKARKKYLPLMREAVKKGNAKSKELALMEDRVALEEGKKQIYGSQLGWDMKGNTYYLVPIEDPDNVDKRRISVGLSSLSDYLSSFGLTWDIEQYRKNLPAIEAQWEQLKKSFP